MTGSDSSLHQRLAEVASEVKALCPDAIVEISREPYETEDADVIVQCPQHWDFEQCDTLGMHMAERTLQILLDDNLSIHVLVREPPDRVRLENETYRASLQRAS